MLSALKKYFNKDTSHDENNIQAANIMQELSLLEEKLADDPKNNTTQKALMVKYNQAVKVCAASKDYRNHVDDIFIKIDELRNTIRKNI
ncbi:MAG: hypothetical protein XXXJIFNMEKO3_02696 [Candidatus Erwinia impunctatus]|nr:hypothetical protein XXXJIFNMEKO_02696 [Culicoides impunctatus]